MWWEDLQSGRQGSVWWEDLQWSCVGCNWQQRLLLHCGLLEDAAQIWGQREEGGQKKVRDRQINGERERGMFVKQRSR